MAKLYRVIEYDGSQEWIDSIIDQAIHEVKLLQNGDTITAATIDPNDKLTITFARDILRNATATIRETKE